MLVSCGIAEREGKFLICRRPACVPYAGYWEFPSGEVEGNETLEDSLENAFFDRLTVKLRSHRSLGAFDSQCEKNCRIFPFFAIFDEKKPALTGYDCAKWVSFKKLRKFRLFPDSVTIIRKIEKFSKVSV